MNVVRSTAASGSVIYESQRAVSEYVQFHFGNVKDVFPYENMDEKVLNFIPRSVKDTIQLYHQEHPKSTKILNSLDIGCAVGRATFEFSQYTNVLGMDYSKSFIDAAKKMQQVGEMKYSMQMEGDVFAEKIATLPCKSAHAIDFQVGDACALGNFEDAKFDIVFASNLLCRLPSPMQFLNALPNIVQTGGIVALISPYSWLEEYTAKQDWLSTSTLTSFEKIQQVMQTNGFTLLHQQDYPFLIREHARKFQYGVSDGCFYIKS